MGKNNFPAQRDDEYDIGSLFEIYPSESQG